ncbi:hypothetical protein [Beijerinckia sp. L45]|uniref:hypothetical protein n=1 Tax=Beijerinckia sp. L45 TaxID=1641855 RepID=UPI00131E7328|nr:hypothetical protein [Beijerinckia sp. L45]
MPLRSVCTALILGAALTLPLASSRAETGSVAYPNNPSATPAANDGGKSIGTDPSCADAPCPAKPAASGGAGSATRSDQAAGIKTPASAYPGSPVKTPAADGKAPP